MIDFSVARDNLILDILSRLTVRWPVAFPDISAHVIGSASKRNVTGPKDLDLLFVDLATQQPLHKRKFPYLVKCLEKGHPFEGAFDTASNAFKCEFRKIISAACQNQDDVVTDVSFAFGPARGEVKIADDALHVHVSGPISLADLEPLATHLPFHAARFRRNHRTLVGPPLASLIPARAPTIDDLRFWDDLLVRRFRNAKGVREQRKWIRHMIAHRRELPTHEADFGEITERITAELAAASSKELERALEKLIDSAEEAA